MVQMHVLYQGQKHCELTHGPSGTKISTDAPKDNNGRGEAFSPTDLCTVSLAACKLTTMAIFAEKENLSLDGAYANVTKEMAANPRRISKMGVTIHLPKNLSEDWRKRLESAAHDCPVSKSLHPDVLIDAQYLYDL